ncbi:MAG: hypothetical protein NZ959_07800 [Armatimonadetes bacterium]|nr:hypothetical protein [Armatimonadota bacterium]MDW8121688.1 cytochrome c3 family protein [Armatimonadota bacterium]
MGSLLTDLLDIKTKPLPKDDYESGLRKGIFPMSVGSSGAQGFPIIGKTWSRHTDREQREGEGKVLLVKKAKPQWHLTVGLLLLLGWSVSLSGIGQEQRRPKPRYVGSAVCFECHNEVAREWARLPHSQILLEDKWSEDKKGCEACHGPGGWHIVTRKGNIVSWNRLKPQQQNQICLPCHQAVTEADWNQSPHGSQTAGKGTLPTCITCHEVHLSVPLPKMLKDRTDRLCLQCHQDIVAKARKGLHHPVGDPPPRCGACHDAHHSPHPALLKEKPMTLCQRCHEPDDIKPKDHTPAFLKDHGKKFKETDPTCQTCHGRTGCSDCHGLPMPHPKGFATKHTQVTLQQPQTCSRCHNQSFCNNCHSELPPASHDQANYAAKSHVAERRKYGLPYCTLCHQLSQCDDCHRQKGVPLENR